MTSPSYRGHRFPAAIIQHAIWLYLRFSLSYRDVEELLAERGLDLSYESVRRWVLKFGPIFARRLREHRPRPGDRWHLDEMVVGQLGGNRLDHMCHGVPLVAAGCYVKKCDLIGALLAISSRNLDWIAGVTNIDETHTLDDTSVVYIKAGNNAFGKRHYSQSSPVRTSARRCASAKSRVPS